MTGGWLQSLIGLTALVGLAWLMSENRKQIAWKWVAGALAAQIILALAFLKIPLLWAALAFLSRAVATLDQAAKDGAAFVFGFAGGGPAPFPVPGDGTSVIVAFQILPIVIVTAAVAALLWHWRVLPYVIRGLSRALEKSLGIGGAAGLGTAANLFLGVVEAPLFIRDHIARLTRTELFMVMTAGLATVSGVVLVLYATLLTTALPDATSHILTASVISLPAALLMARVMIPGPASSSPADDAEHIRYASSLDAIVQGTMDGMKLYLTIIAILIVVFALVSLADQALGLLPNISGEPLTLTRLFGWIFAPIVLLFGIAPSEAMAAGKLMGIKAILNEFVSYQALATESQNLSPRTVLIMTYAMCGFANLASIGMLVSSLSTLCPDRRTEIVGLGFKSWVAGNLATGMTGAVVGLIS